VPNITKKEIETFYEKDYFDGKLANFSSGALSDDVPFEKKWFLQHYLKTEQCRRILEIGPGRDGGMIKFFRADSEKQLQCVEISKYASEILNQNNLPTFNGYIYDFKTVELFDLCMASEVLEHELEPEKFLQSTASVLKPGGTLFITTGNTSSWSAKLMRDTWYYRDPPAHLHYFNTKNIEKVMIKCGFSKVQVFNAGFDTIKLLLKFKAPFALPLISALNIMTGMLVIAKK
jgi:SAM-dependent methyltransferase